jgi:NAD(P)-dependent dehydrogenase (short-subunit alcohol dehydrogenase family)
MSLVVITGANKGIGLEFCKQYKELGFDVAGLCRSASRELKGLGIKILEGIDVADSRCIARVAAEFKGTNIDLLVNNAGILTTEGIDDYSPEAVLRQFSVNSVAPIQLTIALLPSLGVDAKVAMISSRMGSISDNQSGGYYGYRMSKAALNAGAVSLARDLATRKIHIGIYHPGFVKTDMTSNRGEIEPAVAVSGIRKRIAALNAKNSGLFYHSNGEALEW